MFKVSSIILVLVALCCFAAGEVRAQSTEFVYQGTLKDGANPANGSYDFEFRLFDALSGGSQVGSLLTRSSVPVSDGIFSVSLNFGTVFPGSDRFLEIRAKNPGAASFTPLNPRQKLTSTPYSVKSLSSDNAFQLGGVAANQYVVTTDPRMTDARNPLANSPNYIQNTAVQQAASNFSISGNGTAGGTLSGDVVNATTQYNIGGNHALSIDGTSTYAGIAAGTVATGGGNSFFGGGAGNANTNGFFNSFFGTKAGFSNTNSILNSYFGYEAGLNAIGGSNSFFGGSAGRSNTAGSSNSIFGSSAGINNSTGSSNSFFGSQSGSSNTTGMSNAFYGDLSGFKNTTGSSNSFFGQRAGFDAVSGAENTSVGFMAGVGIVTGTGNSMFGALTSASDNLTNATAVGHRAHVTQNNSLVLGSINLVNGATSDTNVGIGTTTPARRLHVSSGTSGATSLASTDLVIEDDNAAFQHFLTPDDIESGILFGDPAASIGGGIIFNNAIANNGIQFRSGGNTTRMTLDGSGNLGIGTAAPNNRLEVIGTIGVSTLGSAGATHLCRNASNQISTCSSLRPDLAGETLSVSVEEMRSEITALRKANAAQQEQIDKQNAQIQALLRLACSQTSDPVLCGK